MLQPTAILTGEDESGPNEQRWFPKKIGHPARYNVIIINHNLELFLPFIIFSFQVYTSQLLKCTCNTKQYKVVHAISSTSCQKNLAHIGCPQSTLVWIFLERMEGYYPLTLSVFRLRTCKYGSVLDEILFAGVVLADMKIYVQCQS